MNRIRKIFTDNKYLKLELVFFFVIEFGIPLISDFEYTYYENKVVFNNGTYGTSVIRRIVWGVFGFVPYFLFYKFVIKEFLIKKKYWLFVFYFLLFVLVLDLYHHFIMYKFISLSWWLPQPMIIEANKVISKPYIIHYNLNYLIKQIVVFSALAYFINYREQEKKTALLQKLQLEADLQSLKSQIHPHFFFNTLNNIYALALKQSSNTAPMIAKLSHLMRYVMDEGGKPLVPLEMEINFIKDYVALHKLRYSQNIIISLDIQGCFSNTFIAPLILLPVIENTFKHGLDDELNNGFVQIVIYFMHNELILNTENSINELTQKIKTRNGIGLDNLKKRLVLLYPNTHTFVIEETEKTFKVSQTIIL